MKWIPCLVVGLLLFAPGARAQVIINKAALDQLAGIVPPPAMPPPAPPAVQAQPRKASFRRVRPKLLRPRPHPPGPVAAAPAEKPIPPATVQKVVAKPVPPPLPKAAPAPAPKAVIRFAAGDAGLPGGSGAALRPFCAPGSGLITIDAYAAPDASDPSAAARLSMSRAFAIRDALTACGVAPGRIIPRADGAARSADPNQAQVAASP